LEAALSAVSTYTEPGGLFLRIARTGTLIPVSESESHQRQARRMIAAGFIAYEDNDGIVRRLAQPSRHFAEHYRGRVFRDGDDFDEGTNPMRTCLACGVPFPETFEHFRAAGATFFGDPAWALRCRACEARQARTRTLRMRMRHDLDAVIAEACVVLALALDCVGRDSLDHAEAEP
jgi:hypothetical protein